MLPSRQKYMVKSTDALQHSSSSKHAEDICEISITQNDDMLLLMLLLYKLISKNVVTAGLYG